MTFRTASGLFLLVFSFYALTGPGHLSSIDGTLILASARNLMRTGSTSVPAEGNPAREAITRRGIDGRSRSERSRAEVSPACPAVAASRIVAALWRAAGKEPPIAPKRFAFFRNSRVVDGSRASRELGYQPTVFVPQGVRRTAAWYRDACGF
jgi:hypothetical protein